jgi:putative transcriptional regulator
MSDSEQVAHSLQGKLLIGTPMVSGSLFDQSVIYLFAHDAEGAMGLIVNRPLEHVGPDRILEQFDLTPEHGILNMPVHMGGPVEPNRGFVLHTRDYEDGTALVNNDIFSVTSHVSILKDIANGNGPKKAMFALGYSGWAAGQLESEIESGSWIVVPASEALVFDQDNEEKWVTSSHSLGFDLDRLSTTVGHA